MTRHRVLVASAVVAFAVSGLVLVPVPTVAADPAPASGVTATATTAIGATVTMGPPAIPQGQASTLIAASFTPSAVDPADGPVTVEINQDRPGDTLTVFSAEGGLTNCQVVGSVQAVCDWTTPVVGQSATIVLQLGGLADDPAGTVISVSTRALAGATEVGNASTSLLVTDPGAVAVVPEISAVPSAVPADGVVYVTATYTLTRLDADWGPITLELGVVGADRVHAFPEFHQTITGNVSCTTQAIGNFWSDDCTWLSPSVGDRVTIQLALGDFAPDPADPVVPLVADWAPYGSSARTQFTISPVVLAPNFTG